MIDDPFAEFTEDGYRTLVRLGRDRFRFRRFADYRDEGRGVLWRHDVDLSVHRALALARIEAEEAVHATFFVFLHSEFYNALEPAIVARLKELASLGHDVGLHFDLGFYQEALAAGADPLQLILAEQQQLEALLDVPVVACSFHAPMQLPPWAAEDTFGTLVNAYSSYLRTQYRYCSDSNGYWRFDPLNSVLTDPATTRLQVLTHPEWWVPTSMSPRDRVQRCLDGRAASIALRYDADLDRFGRTNLR